MLEHEADKHMVERCTLEGQGEDVGLLEAHVARPAASTLAFAAASNSAAMSTEDDARARAAARKRTVCAPTPQPASSTGSVR